VLGAGVRLAIGSAGIGDRSAAVITVLLAIGVWAASVVLSSTRTAFFLTLGLVALLDLAALPARNAPEYDDRTAFFRTDQVLNARVPITSGKAIARPTLTVLVEPVYSGAQPAFGLAGDVGSTSVTWDCAFKPGMQRLGLAIPPAAITSNGSVDVRLHLTGSPSRESNYLLVYMSSTRGGFLISLLGAADIAPDSTTCTPG
jgi:hypothetical protein